MTVVQDGEDMVKRCMKTTHTHNYGDYNYANSVQGMCSQQLNFSSHQV
jgi:hypothetical protein